MAVLAINGGKKACEREWARWPMWDEHEREQLLGVLESGKWWYGEKVHEFEEQFAAFQGAQYGVTCTNGTAALEAALLALGVGAGDEVIVPPLTFLATASAVLRVNAIPVFADIEEDTFCLDPEDVERKVTDKTKAILPVHFAGYVADMDRLGAVAKRHNLRILEDACHSWGSQWKGKGTGALGALGAFSFQESKNVSCGEGGIVLTDDEALADACRSYTNCGRGKNEPWYQHFVLGGNLRMTEFQAAILLGQMTRVEEQTMRRQANAERLTAMLRQIPGIITLKDEPRMTRRAYHFLPIRVDCDRLGVKKDAFLEALQAEGVMAVPGYPHPLYKNPLFLRKGEGPEYCPVSCPFYGRTMDYSQVCCPVCEKVIEDQVWIWQTALLAEPEAIEEIADAVRKVASHPEELKGSDDVESGGW